jgi:hypothetical protein
VDKLEISCTQNGNGQFFHHIRSVVSTSEITVHHEEAAEHIRTFSNVPAAIREF